MRLCLCKSRTCSSKGGHPKAPGDPPGHFPLSFPAFQTQEGSATAVLKPQHKQILKEFAHAEQRLPKMHKADNATSPARSQRLFKSGLKLFSPEGPGIQTASALLPSVPQGAGKLGRASPQPGVKAKRGGFKPAQAVLPPGQTRLKVLLLPCPGPARSASCEVGLLFTNSVQERVVLF